MSPRPKGSIARTLSIVVSAMLMAGCNFEFDQFEVGPPDAGLDMDMSDGSMDAGPPLDADPDAEADTDVSIDMDQNGEGEIGDECDDDADCPQSCVDNYCTVDCSDGSSCPGDSFCVTFGAEAWCTLPCDAFGECPNDGRDDLACATSSAAAGGLRSGACLPDRDGDGAIDRVDNCVDDKNPGQADADLDGRGDACDDEPLCAAGHTDGVLELGSVPFNATAPAVPDVAGDWFPVVGGETGNGVADLLGVFQREGPSSSTQTLPYAARGFAMVQVGPDEYLMTPGNRGGEGQFGQFVHVFRDGAVRVGIPFQPAVFEPTLARAGDGSIWMHAYVDPASAGNMSWTWRVYRYDPEQRRFVQFRSGTEPRRTRWRSTVDRLGRVYFYSQVFDDATGNGRIIEITPGENAVTVDVASYGGVQQTVDPFLVPAPGGNFFLWDRTTGEGWAFDGAIGASLPGLSITPELTAPRWIAHRTGPGFTIVGHDPDDATMLQARSYSIPCLPGLSSDRDGDGIFDAVDRCPDGDGGAAADDLDDDWIGDSCDSDADGDGLADDASVDPSFGDTDNDGETNDVDDDDDGDGLADAADPFPLDTDQDGIGNALDRDDDDDGYGDLDEGDPASALDPLWFPTSGELVWVDGDEAYVAPLRNTANPETLTRQGDGEPHLPRFLPGGQDGNRSALILDGPPGVARNLEVSSRSTAVAVPVDLVIWGADPLNLTNGALSEIVLTHGTMDDDTATVLSVLNVGPNTQRRLVDVLPGVGAPDGQGGLVTFAAAPMNCTACRSAYQIPVSGGIPTVIASDVSNPSMVRYNGGIVTLLGDASGGGGRSAWLGAEEDFTEYRPPGSTDVRAAVGFADGHLVVSASGADGDAIWFYNGIKRRWHRLRDLTTSEMDWAR